MTRFNVSLSWRSAALVTKEKALMWTDGRYFLQAEQQLSADWTLMKMDEPGVPTIEVCA